MNDGAQLRTQSASDSLADGRQIRFSIAGARSKSRAGAGQEFLGGFGKGLAAIDSHENGGMSPNLSRGWPLQWRSPLRTRVAFFRGFERRELSSRSAAAIIQFNTVD